MTLHTLQDFTISHFFQVKDKQTEKKKGETTKLSITLFFKNSSD